MGKGRHRARTGIGAKGRTISAAIAAAVSWGGSLDHAAAQQTVPLDEITVTARKRPEAAKDIPISLTAIEGAQLEDLSKTRSNADLARSVPNFNFVDLGGQSSNLANIRGVGSFSPVSPDDTSVVFYVDEAPQSVYGIAPNLLDTERVEVLRGPQGTLFGRNAQGGAVNIISRVPTFDRSFSLTGELGTKGYVLGELIANSPLVPNVLAGRMALRYSNFGGDVPNTLLGGNDAATQIGAFRGSLLFTPTERTTVTFSGSYGKDDDTVPRWLLRGGADFPVSAVDPRNDVSRGNRRGVRIAFPRRGHGRGGRRLASLALAQAPVPDDAEQD